MIFAFDLDQTLIFTQKWLTDAPATLAAEHRLGEPYSFMTPAALHSLREIQKRAVCFVNTLRGPEQADRVSFVADGSCRYLALQNGLYLYRNGVPDAVWASHVSRTVRELPLGLDDAVSKVLGTLPGIECLFRQYEYLAVFFVEESFEDDACTELAAVLCQLGWDLYHQRKKLYLCPLSIHKGSVLERVRLLEDGADAVGFGDSRFDLPMLQNCQKAYAPRGCELEGSLFAFPLQFSRGVAQAATEEILADILTGL